MAALVEQEQARRLGRAAVTGRRELAEEPPQRDSPGRRRAAGASERAVVQTQSTLAAIALSLLASACERVGADEPPPASVALEARIAELTAQLERSRADRDGAAAEIQRLRTELDAAITARVARETEWLRYTKGIADLRDRAEVAIPEFAVELPAGAADVEPPPPEPSPAEPEPQPESTPSAELARARAARDHEIFLALRSLFTAEQVHLYDWMESGTLLDGATGPVVLRILDENGRPTGSLCAARMRIEASRAARTLTLVLEDGYERRGTTKIPFESPGQDPDGDAQDSAPKHGVRRIVLPSVDPAPWIEALPELCGESATAAADDDGLWNLVSLRNELNLLLREDAVGGFWRVESLGGVRGSVIRDVVIDQLDRDGRLERKLFADRLTVLREDRGVQLLLESGAQLRGDRKLPFLDGRYRIFLPRADVLAWMARGVPGLSPPPH